MYIQRLQHPNFLAVPLFKLNYTSSFWNISTCPRLCQSPLLFWDYIIHRGTRNCIYYGLYLLDTSFFGYRKEREYKVCPFYSRWAVICQVTSRTAGYEVMPPSFPIHLSTTAQRDIMWLLVKISPCVSDFQKTSTVPVLPTVLTNVLHLPHRMQ